MTSYWHQDRRSSYFPGPKTMTGVLIRQREDDDPEYIQHRKALFEELRNNETYDGVSDEDVWNAVDDIEIKQRADNIFYGSEYIRLARQKRYNGVQPHEIIRMVDAMDKLGDGDVYIHMYRIRRSGDPLGEIRYAPGGEIGSYTTIILDQESFHSEYPDIVGNYGLASVYSLVAGLHQYEAQIKYNEHVFPQIQKSDPTITSRYRAQHIMDEMFYKSDIYEGSYPRPYDPEEIGMRMYQEYGDDIDASIDGLTRDYRITSYGDDDIPAADPPGSVVRQTIVGPYAEPGLLRDDDTKRWVRHRSPVEDFHIPFETPASSGAFNVGKKSKFKGEEAFVYVRPFIEELDITGKYNVSTKTGAKSAFRDVDLSPVEPMQNISMVKTPDELQRLAMRHQETPARLSWDIIHRKHPDFQSDDSDLAEEWMWSGAYNIGRKMRAGEELDATERDIVDAIIKRSKPLSYDEILWRGLRKPPGIDYTPGKQWTLVHPESASRIPNVAVPFTKNTMLQEHIDQSDRIIYQILVPKGTPGMVYNSLNSEVILPPGTNVEVVDTHQPFRLHSEILSSYPYNESRENTDVTVSLVTLRVVPKDDAPEFDVYSDTGTPPRRFRMNMADVPGGHFYHKTPIESRVDEIDVDYLSGLSNTLCPGIYLTRYAGNADDQGSIIEMDIDWKDVREIPVFSRDEQYDDMEYAEIADDMCSIARAYGYPAFWMESDDGRPVMVLTGSDMVNANVVEHWDAAGRRLPASTRKDASQKTIKIVGGRDMNHIADMIFAGQVQSGITNHRKRGPIRPIQANVGGVNVYL